MGISVNKPFISESSGLLEFERVGCDLDPEDFGSCPDNHTICEQRGFCSKKIYRIGIKEVSANLLLDKHLTWKDHDSSFLQKAIRFYNGCFQERNQKKNEKTKKRISLVVFGERHSDDEIESLLENSACNDIQIIVIYDKTNIYEPDPSTGTKKNLEIKKIRGSININPNLLFLPLDFEKNVMGLDEWSHLIRKVVCHAISSFQPDLVVIDHLINFSGPMSTLFDSDCKAWELILSELCNVAFNNILLLSRNLQKEQNVDITKKYCQSSDFILKGKKGLEEFVLPEKCLNKNYEEDLFEVLQQYCNHPWFGSFFMEIKIKILENQLRGSGENPERENLLEMYKSKEIPSKQLMLIDLKFSDFKKSKIETSLHTLSFGSDSRASFIEKSRIIVNYESRIIYCVDVHCQGKLTNYLFILEPGKYELEGEVFPSTPTQMLGRLHIGACFGGNKVFQVYERPQGKLEEGSKVTREIYFADLKEKQWRKPIIFSQCEWKMRHEVICNYSEIGDTKFLYVFAGVASDQSKVSATSSIIEQYTLYLDTNVFYCKKIYCQGLKRFLREPCYVTQHEAEILLLKRKNSEEWLYFIFNVKSQKSEVLKAPVKVADGSEALQKNENWFKKRKDLHSLLKFRKHSFFLSAMESPDSLTNAHFDGDLTKIHISEAKPLEKKIASNLNMIEEKCAIFLIFLQQLAQYLSKNKFRLEESEKHFERSFDFVYQSDNEITAELHPLRSFLFEEDWPNEEKELKNIVDQIKKEFYSNDFDSLFFKLLQKTVGGKAILLKDLYIESNKERCRAKIQKELSDSDFLRDILLPSKQDRKKLDTQLILLENSDQDSYYDDESFTEKSLIFGRRYLTNYRYLRSYSNNSHSGDTNFEENKELIQNISLKYFIELHKSCGLKKLWREVSLMTIDQLRIEIRVISEILRKLEVNHKYFWQDEDKSWQLDFDVDLNLLRKKRAWKKHGKKRLIILLGELAEKEKLDLNELQKSNEQLTENPKLTKWRRLLENWPEVYNTVKKIKEIRPRDFKELERNISNIKTRSCVDLNRCRSAIGVVEHKNGFGTGLLIQQRVVLTAAHVLNIIIGGRTLRMVAAEEVIFRYGENAEHSVQVCQIFYPPEYLFKEKERGNDFAILVLKQDLGLELGYFGINAMDRENFQQFIKRNKFALFGYRLEDGKYILDGQTDGTLKIVDNEILICHVMKSEDGCSGGGCFYLKSFAYISCIHKGRHKIDPTEKSADPIQKFAVQITPKEYEIIKSWVEEANLCSLFSEENYQSNFTRK